MEVSDFEPLQIVGRGQFGQVRRARLKGSGATVALKHVSKASCHSEGRTDQMIREIEISKSIIHPYVVSTWASFETYRDFVVVQECATHSLSSILAQAVRFEEKMCRKCGVQLGHALRHLHSLRILHRDVKTENVLVDSYGNLKLCDFGFARSMSAQGMATTTKGTPLYMAPEVIRAQPYGEQADLWSMGIILFELLFGTTPFVKSTLYDLVTSIAKDPLPDVDWKAFSIECRDFLSRLLVKNPSNRLDWNQGLLDHSWLEESPIETEKRLTDEQRAQDRFSEAVKMFSQLKSSKQPVLPTSPRLYRETKHEFAIELDSLRDESVMPTPDYESEVERARLLDEIYDRVLETSHHSCYDVLRSYSDLLIRAQVLDPRFWTLETSAWRAKEAVKLLRVSLERTVHSGELDDDGISASFDFFALIVHKVSAAVARDQYAEIDRRGADRVLKEALKGLAFVGSRVRRRAPPFRTFKDLAYLVRSRDESKLARFAAKAAQAITSPRPPSRSSYATFPYAEATITDDAFSGNRVPSPAANPWGTWNCRNAMARAFCDAPALPTVNCAVAVLCRRLSDDLATEGVDSSELRATAVLLAWVAHANDLAHELVIKGSSVLEDVNSVTQEGTFDDDLSTLHAMLKLISVRCDENAASTAVACLPMLLQQFSDSVKVSSLSLACFASCADLLAKSPRDSSYNDIYRKVAITGLTYLQRLNRFDSLLFEFSARKNLEGRDSRPCFGLLDPFCALAALRLDISHTNNNNSNNNNKQDSHVWDALWLPLFWRTPVVGAISPYGLCDLLKAVRACMEVHPKISSIHSPLSTIEGFPYKRASRLSVFKGLCSRRHLTAVHRWPTERGGGSCGQITLISRLVKVLQRIGPLSDHVSESILSPLLESAALCLIDYEETSRKTSALASKTLRILIECVREYKKRLPKRKLPTFLSPLKRISVSTDLADARVLVDLLS